LVETNYLICSRGVDVFVEMALKARGRSKKFCMLLDYQIIMKNALLNDAGSGGAFCQSHIVPFTIYQSFILC